MAESVSQIGVKSEQDGVLTNVTPIAADLSVTPFEINDKIYSTKSVLEKLVAHAEGIAYVALDATAPRTQN